MFASGFDDRIQAALIYVNYFSNIYKFWEMYLMV